MMAALYEIALSRPNLLHGFASLLWRCGWFGLLAGVLARAIDAILAVPTSMGAPGPQATYQLLLPGVPTWWIPESVSGVAVYIGLMVAGYALSSLALEFQRQVKAL
jgi:hypothetical protein